MRDVTKTIGAIGAIVNGAGLRAALCDYCDGCGFVHEFGRGVTMPAVDLRCGRHVCTRPGIRPCFDCQPCPKCSRDGCGPGVRWVEVTP